MGDMQQFIKRDPTRGYLGLWLWIPKSYVNVEATKSALTFELDNKYRDDDEEKTLALWDEAPQHLLVPRAFWNVASLPFEVSDCRPSKYHQEKIGSRIQLDHRIQDVAGQKILAATGDSIQSESLLALQAANGGTLQLACGRGKTVVALEKIAQDGVPSLIILDNSNLLSQWREDIEEFLDVPGGVGLVAGGKFDWKKMIVLATYQTLASKSRAIPPEMRRWFGNIFWDEGHHVSAPTFSRTASMFYGNRYTLTATPEREDGLHIISQLHIGPVLYKYLVPMMRARFIFNMTGMSLDMADESVEKAVTDVTGEVHNSKVTSFLAGHIPHLHRLFVDAINAVRSGRKVLLLTDSVAEAVNLMALWTRGWGTPLYTDIPFPEPHELEWSPEELQICQSVDPLFLSDAEVKKLKHSLKKLWHQIATIKKRNVAAESEAVKELDRWARYRLARRFETEYERRQRKFLKDLIAENSGSGIMTYGVPDEERQRFLKERQIVFAITKYGKEGLDCVTLDTVLVSSLFSAQGGLQQLMGRPTRPSPGKKSPLLVFYVHNIGQHIGMSIKLQKHLRSWPHDEGGPFDYEILNHKGLSTCKTPSLEMAFGQ